MSATQPRIVFHLLPPSHPCATVEAALKLKGLEYERVELQAGPHIEQMERIYGEERHDRPGRADRRRARPRLQCDPRAPGGAGARAVAVPGRPAATRVAPPSAGATTSCRISAAACRGARCTSGPRRRAPSSPAAAAGPGRHRLRHQASSAARGSTTRSRPSGWPRISRACPRKLDRVDAYVAEGILARRGSPTPPTSRSARRSRSCCTVGDVRPLIEGRPAEQVARKWFDDRPGVVPAGAFPAGWVPQR